jgi:hypothetical protein
VAFSQRRGTQPADNNRYFLCFFQNTSLNVFESRALFLKPHENSNTCGGVDGQTGGSRVGMYCSEKSRMEGVRGVWERWDALLARRAEGCLQLVEIGPAMFVSISEVYGNFTCGTLKGVPLAGLVGGQ